MSELEPSPEMEPVYYFKSTITICPFCDKKLTVAHHTGVRKVITLKGTIKAKHIVQLCKNKQCHKKGTSKRRMFPSEQFQMLSLPQCEIGLDLTLYIGYHMHIKHQSLDEVYNSLQSMEVPINRSTVYRHYRNYLNYMLELTEQSTTALIEEIRLNRGYILAIDVVHSINSPALLVCRDILVKRVLRTKLINYESDKDIIPILELIQQDFGNPIAVVSDMGHGIKKSIEHVFPRTKHQYCHYHFLKNLGKALMETDYITLKYLVHENKKKSKN